MSDEEKPVPLRVIKEHLSVGAVVDRVEAIICFVNEYKTGEYKSGRAKGQSYSRQNILIADKNDPDEKLFIMVQDHPEVSIDEKDKVVELVASRNPQGSTGIYVDSYEKNGEPVKSLRMTKSGAFLIEGFELADKSDQNSQPDTPETPQPARTSQDRQSSAQTTKANPGAKLTTKELKIKAVKEAKLQIATTGYVYEACFDFALVLSKKFEQKAFEAHGKDEIQHFTLNEIKEIASNIFIRCGYDNITKDPNLPARSFHDPVFNQPEAVKPDPTPPKPDPQTQSVDDAMDGKKSTERKPPPPGYKYAPNGDLVELEDLDSILNSLYYL